MTMITRQRLAEIADELSEGFRHGNLDVMHDAATAIVDELRTASVEPEPTTMLLSGMVDARELDDRYVGYRMGVNLTSTPDGREILTIASVESITHQGVPGVRLTFAEYPGHHYDARGGINVYSRRVSGLRRPFVPAAQYAGNSGARMADAIEVLESKLGAIELTLDAHRAALVAAGWLDVNGEPVMKHDQR